jgi:4-aminobutyrate aminotransferase-like enzyme
VVDVIEREGLLGHVRANEGPFREMLDSLLDLPIVGDVRGAGCFHAIELVKYQHSKQRSATRRRRSYCGDSCRARCINQG